MGIELIILKGMFIAAAIGFAVQQIISVNRELKKDAEKAAREAETAEPAAQEPAPAAARAETAQPATATDASARKREPAEVA